MTQTFTHTTTVTRGLEEYEVTCEFEVPYWGSAGAYWEPPDGMEINPLSFTIEAPAWARDWWPHGEIPFALTQAESMQIEEAIYMDPPEQDYGPDPDDERDRRYDESRYDIGNGIGGDNRQED